MRPRIRTNVLTEYAGLARSSGLDPAVVLGRVGLDLAVPDRWIPAAPVARLLEVSAQQSGCPDFGLRLAQLPRLGTLGPLSVALRDEPDLRSAVALLTEYAPAYNEALRLRLREDGDRAVIEVWLEFGEPAPRDQVLDLVMAELSGIIRALLGSGWRPRSAGFVRSPPADAEPWRRLFGPRVVFARRSNSLVLQAQELGARVITSDPSLRPYTRRFLDTVVAPRPPAATAGLADVAEAVELLLPLGRLSLTRASRRLGLRPRELQRYLAQQDQTFSSVLDTTRARLVERFLTNGRYSLTEVSQLLGFSAPSAFSRWFRRQFGTSPTEWRRAARARSESDATSAWESRGWP
ncbi:AraC family transcriptional regulator [Geodermatophilus sp. CPCC 205761]|uniref:AraC family transcriptional regulator n=1 Tax=Geodermatophilus sp. CPCC 205761 TaxID=2936597 RepID=UPI003EEA3723